MSINKFIRLMILLFPAVFLLNGCARYYESSILLGDMSQTPQEYLVAVQDHMTAEERMVEMDYATALKKFQDVSKRCYQYEVSHRSARFLTYKEDVRNRWTSKVTVLGKGHAFFTMQKKGLKNSTINHEDNEKIPEDGMWVYSIEILAAGKNTKTLIYAPWGWGNTVNTIVDTVEGKYGDECPPNDKRHI